jgi:hypothetical protein
MLVRPTRRGMDESAINSLLDPLHVVHMVPISSLRFTAKLRSDNSEYYLYKETFYPNITTPQEAYLRGHLGKLSSPSSTTAIQTHYLPRPLSRSSARGNHVHRRRQRLHFFWSEPKRSRPDTETASKRQCVNWGRFEEWSKEHMVPGHAATKGGLSPL